MLKSTSITLTALACALCALSGCGTGEDRRATTSKATASVPAETSKAIHDLDAVDAGIKDVRDADDKADLKKLHGDLTTRATALKGSLAEVSTGADSAVAAGKEQISKWHQESDTYTDASLRDASNKRESSLRKAVEELSTSNASLKAAVGPYQAKLGEALSALDLDMSTSGVKSVKPIMGKLSDQSSDVRDALHAVSDKSKALHAVLNK